jgi:hypothetical protein
MTGREGVEAMEATMPIRIAVVEGDTLTPLVSLALLAARRISLRSVICFGPFMLGGALLAILATGM